MKTAQIAIKLLLSLVFIVNFTVLTSAATFLVDSLGDSADADLADNLCLDSAGNCTFRAAIQQGNAASDVDTITFRPEVPALSY
jgi:hypothetical protein